MSKSFFAKPDGRKESVVVFGSDQNEETADVALRINPNVFTGQDGATTIASSLANILTEASRRLADRLGADDEHLSNGRLLGDTVNGILHDAKPAAAPSEVYVITGTGGYIWAIVASYDAAIDWIADHGSYADAVEKMMADNDLSKADAVAATLALANVETCLITSHGTAPRPGFDSVKHVIDLIEIGESVLDRMEFGSDDDLSDEYTDCDEETAREMDYDRPRI